MEDIELCVELLVFELVRLESTDVRFDDDDGTLWDVDIDEDELR